MRILVTRPEREAIRTAAKLGAEGHKVLCAPLLTVQATEIQPPTGDYPVILVTSVNGAARLDTLSNWRDRIIYAVGPRTGDAVRALGDVRDLRIATGDAVSMIAMVTKEIDRKQRILHVTGIDHKAEPDASLRSAGFSLQTWEAYEAVASGRLPESVSSALRSGSLDAALHYSRRSVDIVLRLVTAQGLAEPFLALTHFCLSQDVAEPLRNASARSISVASHPSEDSLFAAINNAGKP